MSAEYLAAADKLEIEANIMPHTPDSTKFDTLTAVQAEVLKALVGGLSITAAAERGGVHRSTVHLWSRHHPTFAHTLLAARRDQADHLLDELSSLARLACDTFRQILSDENAPAATRLKAAMEIVKLVQNQRPTELATMKADVNRERFFDDLRLAEVANAAAPEPVEPIAPTSAKEPVRNSPCPCGSRLKYKRCCGNPVHLARAA